MTAHVLVVNAGSSSLKYSLVDADTGVALATGLVERIGEESGGSHTHTGPDGTKHREDRQCRSHEEALRTAVDAFGRIGPSLTETPITAVGHRVVHGGARFADPVVVDDQVLAAVADLVPLAPLHNPANLEGLTVARRLFPDLPHVAVFDTAFHQTIPPRAYTYAVPLAWRDEHRIRRYGFHGTSHQFVSGEAARMLGRDPAEVNVIVLHLGNGASATAVRAGESVDTSMGLTPLEGLVMGTRSGDIDPALHAHLARQFGWTLEQIDTALNRDSGLKGIAGQNDFREVVRLRAEGDPAAELAFDVYAYRIRKYVGAYYAVLGSVDAIVFTAGVGEHNPDLREAALAGLDRLGIRLDLERNRGEVDGPTLVSPAGADVAVLVIPTNEEWEIARQTLTALGR
ncbi:MAG: acetate kinase [Nocardioides sp.]|uniref:acetate/propionate family kinase n=1 Tax=Nocardioides sp. TaxID=35761 RepID=UPI0039E2A3BB